MGVLVFPIYGVPFPSDLPGINWVTVGHRSLLVTVVVVFSCAVLGAVYSGYYRRPAERYSSTDRLIRFTSRLFLCSVALLGCWAFLRHGWDRVDSDLDELLLVTFSGSFVGCGVSAVWALVQRAEMIEKYGTSPLSSAKDVTLSETQQSKI